MNRITVSIAFAAIILVAAGRPAAAAESASGLFEKLTSSFSGVQQAGAANKEKALKHICQKGNFLGGVVGICRSGEGIVCGFKQEAFALCSVICGSIGANYQGFNDSKCVTKHGSKFDFGGKTPVEWAAARIVEKAGAAGQHLGSVCGLLKTHGSSISQLAPLTKACATAGK